MKQKLYLIFLLTIMSLNANKTQKLTQKLINNLTYFMCHGVVPGVFGFLNYCENLHDNVEKYKIAFNITAGNMQNINWSHYHQYYCPSFGNNIQMTVATYLLMYSGYSTFLTLRGCKKMLGYYKNNVPKKK